MPVTHTYVPVLSQFFAVVGKMSSQQEESGRKQLPKGVVLGKDGKPCRSCTSFAAWAQMTKADNPPARNNVAAPATMSQLPDDCPADVEQLGRSSWTLLHTMAANYPERPTFTEQQTTRSFVSLFSRMYPCGHCAEDFRAWLNEAGNAPRVSNRDEFGRWMCEAHNAVNVKLGKERFDCSKWEERWRTGPPDGPCA